MSTPDRPAGGTPGQWVHADLFGASVAAWARLSLGEGGTPLEPAPELGAGLGVPGLWLKREDGPPTGSHKSRSLGLLVSQLRQQRRGQAVISSSGNAAVAAATYCSLAGIRLLSLVSPRTPAVKLHQLLQQPQLVAVTETPVALLHHAVAAWGMADLRASTNPLGAAAYRGIAAELARQGSWEAVFVFSNSGATALGLQQGFTMLLPPSARPQIHPVEASPGGELTRPWYPRERAPASGVGDLGARRSRLAPTLRRAVRESGGRGWRVGREEMERVLGLARGCRLDTSWEGLAALAAAAEHARLDRPAGGRVAVVLTGAGGQRDLRPPAQLPTAARAVAGPAELDRLLRTFGFAAEGARS